MSETALIGAMQVLATLLVFIAVESRMSPLPKGSYDRQGFIFFLELLGMGLMWLALLMGAAELVIPEESLSPFSVIVVAIGLLAGLIMCFVSIHRIVNSRLRKAIDDQPGNRGNSEHQDGTHD